MARVRGEFEYDDDLTPGKTGDGGWSGLLFKDGEPGVVDHGAFYPDSDDETDEVDEDSAEPSSDWVIPVAIGLAVGAMVTFVAVKATPRVRRWWNEDALPAIRAKWKDGSTSGESGVDVSVRVAVTDDDTHTSFADEVDSVLEDAKTPMSSREAQERLLSILLAAAFIAEQMRELHNASIEPDDELADLALQNALAKLTTQEITDSINRVLEADAFTMTDDTSCKLMEYFGCGRNPDGQHVPLTNDLAKAALLLPTSRP
ncbi:MAG: hypothetical protein WCF12_07795 [Propionicimonas sp.]